MASVNGKKESGPLENAEAIIERFGGIRPMASKMDVPVTTVQGWKKRNAIPENRRADVLHVAQVNNIDLSDLIGRGGVNENTAKNADAATGTETVPPFRAAVDDASKSRTTEDERRHQEALRAAHPHTPPSSSPFNQETLMGKIRAAEQNAVRKSVWISIMLVAAVGIIVAVLLWPINDRVEQNGRDIAALRGEVGGVSERVSGVERTQAFLRGLVPEGLEQQVDSLQQQTANIQSRISELGQRADVIAGGVLGPDAGTMEQRLAVLEQQVGEITGNGNLTPLFDRLRSMQQSFEGQEKLSQSVSDLVQLVRTLPGGAAGIGDGDLNDLLASARQQGGPLGETLEGVDRNELTAAAMLLGLSQFRTSLRRNEPFDEDLTLMMRLMGDRMSPELQASVQTLAPKARQGVLTPQGLSNEFRGLTGEIVTASLRGEDVAVGERARARMNELLQVEKDGELITGTDTQATVARAQRMLDDGDIQGAIAALQGLEGPAAQTAQPWIEEAQMTLLAEKVQEMLTTNVAARIGSTAPYTARSGGLGGLVRQIESLSPINGRTVVTDEESGFSILPRQLKIPDMSLER